MIGHAPKIRMMKEHGRHLRLDDDAEKRLLAGAPACNWRQRTRELFRDIVILMRDTGMRNQREFYRVRIENRDWENRMTFVPDSKTPEGRRLVPMSRRVLERLRAPCGTRAEGLGVSVQAFCCGSPSLNRSAVSKGAATSRPPEGTGPFIVPAMITALESSCGPGTWPRS